MKLSVLERINLMGILPQEGNYITFKILSDLRGELSFTENEIKDFKITQHDVGEGKIRFTWDDKKEKAKEIPIGEQVLIIIRTALQKVEKEGRVNSDNVTLIERFLPEVLLGVKK
jgi:flagellar hook assembly protein FlgD